MKKSELKKIIHEEIQKLNEEKASGYDAALKKFLKFIYKQTEAFTKKNYSKIYEMGNWEYPTVLKSGKRFDKLVMVRLDEPKKPRSAHAFIERATGDIYKPAGWNAPAKGVRASIFKPDSYKRFDPHGGWLYRYK